MSQGGLPCFVVLVVFLSLACNDGSHFEGGGSFDFKCFFIMKILCIFVCLECICEGLVEFGGCISQSVEFFEWSFDSSSGFGGFTRFVVSVILLCSSLIKDSLVIIFISGILGTAGIALGLGQCFDDCILGILGI